MQPSDPFKFRKFLKRLVRFTQGLLRYSDFLSVDESNPSAALRTLSGLMKQEFEDDFLELACRMYEAWRNSQKDTAAATICRVVGNSVGKQQCRTLTLLRERTAGIISRRPQSKPTSAFFPGRRVDPHPSSSKLQRSSNSLSSSSEFFPRSSELLKSAPTKSELLRELYSPTSGPQPSLLGFERLYEDHIRRQNKEAARKEASEQFEMQSLSFSPAVNNSGLPPRVKIPVFERLTLAPESRNSMTSEERELLSASFTPSLTSKQYFSSGVGVETMHNRAKITQKKIRKMQLQARSDEMAPCSFTPAVHSRSNSITSTASSSRKSIFEKLYAIHKRTQRKLREKAEQKAEEERKQTPFRPTINTHLAANSVDSLPNSASERLFADYRFRQEKLALLRSKYAQKSQHRAYSAPVEPAHERLYELQKGRKERQAELRAKVMRDEGATFQPHLLCRGRID